MPFLCRGPVARGMTANGDNHDLPILVSQEFIFSWKVILAAPGAWRRCPVESRSCRWIARVDRPLRIRTVSGYDSRREGLDPIPVVPPTRIRSMTKLAIPIALLAASLAARAPAADAGRPAVVSRIKVISDKVEDVATLED